MSEPRTEAGKQLLRSDFDTTGYGPSVVREHVTKAVLWIEDEAFGEAEQHRLDAESWRVEAERVAARFNDERDRADGWKAQADEFAAVHAGCSDALSDARADGIAIGRQEEADATDRLLEALEKIVAMDYRGNEPPEHRVARMAVLAHWEPKDG